MSLNKVSEILSEVSTWIYLQTFRKNARRFFLNLFQSCSRITEVRYILWNIRSSFSRDFLYCIFRRIYDWMLCRILYKYIMNSQLLDSFLKNFLRKITKKCLYKSLRQSTFIFCWFCDRNSIAHEPLIIVEKFVQKISWLGTVI